MTSDFYVDEPVLTVFFVGDIRTFLNKFQGRLRYLSKGDYKDYSFLVMCDNELYPYIEDFVKWNIDLPDWFLKKNLTPLNYEAVSGGNLYTDPDVYMKLMKYFRQFYNTGKALEFWCPRGDSKLMEVNSNEFINYPIQEIKSDKNIVMIYVSDEIEKEVWDGVIETLNKKNNVVLYNNSRYDFDNAAVVKSMKDVMAYTKNSVMTITVDNQFAYIPVILNTSVFIIGENGDKIINKCRLLKVPGKYKQSPDLKLITAKDIIDNV